MGASYSETAVESAWSYWEDEIVDSGASQEPWDMKIADGEASFSNCVYRRGPVTMFIEVDPLAFTEDGDYYIAAKLNVVDGTVEMIASTEYYEAADTSVPADTDFTKILLYKVAISEGLATVLVDYRKAPNPVLYV